MPTPWAVFWGLMILKLREHKGQNILEFLKASGGLKCSYRPWWVQIFSGITHCRLPIFQGKLLINSLIILIMLSAVGKSNNHRENFQHFLSVESICCIQTAEQLLISQVRHENKTLHNIFAHLSKSQINDNLEYILPQAVQTEHCGTHLKCKCVLSPPCTVPCH